MPLYATPEELESLEKERRKREQAALLQAELSNQQDMGLLPAAPQALPTPSLPFAGSEAQAFTSGQATPAPELPAFPGVSAETGTLNIRAPEPEGTGVMSNLRREFIEPAQAIGSAIGEGAEALGSRLKRQYGAEGTETRNLVNAVSSGLEFMGRAFEPARPFEEPLAQTGLSLASIPGATLGDPEPRQRLGEFGGRLRGLVTGDIGPRDFGARAQEQFAQESTGTQLVSTALLPGLGPVGGMVDVADISRIAGRTARTAGATALRGLPAETAQALEDAPRIPEQPIRRPRTAAEQASAAENAAVAPSQRVTPPSEPPMPPREPPPVGTKPPPQSFHDAQNEILRYLRKEKVERQKGIVAEQISQGRRRQAAGISEAFREAESQGLQGAELARAARKGARGRLTTARPLDIAPEHFEALYERVNKDRREGVIKPFQYSQETIALDVLRSGEQRLQPAQIDRLRRLLGDDVTDLIAERNRSINPPTQEQRTAIQQLTERFAKESEVLAATRQPYDDAQAAQKRLQQVLRNFDKLSAAMVDRARLKALDKLNALDNAEIERTQKYINDVRRKSEAAEARTAATASRQAAALGAATDVRNYRQRLDGGLSDLRNAVRTGDQAMTQRLESQLNATVNDALQAGDNSIHGMAINTQIEMAKLMPNEQELLLRARSHLSEPKPFEKAGVSESVRRAAIDTIDLWLRGNRAIMDALSPEMGGLFQSVQSVFTGDLPDSFLTTFMHRKATLVSVLSHQLDDPALAQRIANDLMEAELTHRYGKQLPDRVGQILQQVKSLPYEESTGALEIAVQRAKNTAFGFDIGVFGIQTLNAINTGGVQLMAGAINRMLALAQLPHVRTTYADVALPKLTQYALDGVHQAAGPSAFRKAEGTLLQYIPGVGKYLDMPVMALADTLNRIQFNGVLGMVRNTAYEGNLVLAHLARQDIGNAAVRAAAAENANALTGWARRALNSRRATAERVLLTSAPMSRSMVSQLLQVSKVLRPGATATERLLGAMTIASVASSTLLVGKLVNDWIGTEDFEFDPSMPNFGRIRLPDGTKISLFPQTTLIRAITRSVRELSEADPQTAARQWGNLLLGRTSLVGEVIAGAFGTGYEPGRGFRYGNLAEGKGVAGRIVNLAPMPPIIQTVLTENFTPSQLALESAGISAYPESAYDVRNRTARDLFKSDYKDLEPSQKKQIDAQENVKEAQAAEPPRSQGDVALRTVEADRLSGEQQAVDRYKQSGDAKAFREQVSAIQSEAAIKRAQADSDFQIYKQTDKLPDDPGKAALVQYYAVFDKARLAGGVLDFEALDREMAKIEGSWTPEQKTYVERNTGLTEHVPEVKVMLGDKRKIQQSGYWDIADRIAVRVAAKEGISASSYDELQSMIRQRVSERLKERGQFSNAESDRITNAVLSDMGISDLVTKVRVGFLVDNPEIKDLLDKLGYSYPAQGVKERQRELSGAGTR